VILVIGGYFIFSSMQKNSPKDTMMKDGAKTEQDSTGDKKMEEEKDAMMMESTYGKVIAGKSSPFVEFNKTGFDKAIADGKIVFLNFYANWCPTCRVEAPIIDSGFNSLQTSNIVGFRVNFKDSDTDKDEEFLAKQFNVPYQHTKIFLVNGKEIDRYPNQWSKESFDKAFNKVLQ
jgi:thioredoxin 1